MMTHSHHNPFASHAAHAAANALGIKAEFNDLSDITATRCCICSADLTDAVSVNRGIGPICSRKYYEVEHVITDQMVQVALGLLFASKLDGRVKVFAKRLKDQPRDLCNLLVKWASANYDQTEIVFECSDVIAALGFRDLATVLRERRTQVVIAEDPMDAAKLTVHTAGQFHFGRNMTRIPGVAKATKRGRFTLNYSFPKQHLDLVLVCLGDAFGDRWATFPDRVARIQRKSWMDVKAAFDALFAPKPVTPAPAPVAAQPTPGIVRVVGALIEVHTPKRNFNFVEELKRLPGRDRAWNPDRMCWVVAATHEAKVRDLVNKHFGAC